LIITGIFIRYVRKDNKRAACATESAAGIASFSHKNEIFNVVLAKNA
jgi:hypothetical protein